MDNDFSVVQELNPLELVKGINRKNKKLQAILLQEFENIVGKDSPHYESYRKTILDESNNYARSIVRLVFGDIDSLIR
jgi:hypothetical protein